MTEKEKAFIYEHFSIKGAEWCALKLKKRLVNVQMYAAKRRMLILNGKSDEIYARYVAPKVVSHEYRVSYEKRML